MTQRAPFTWTTTSVVFQDLLERFIDKDFNVLEMGSSTGHISFRMAEKGYKITLLDIRSDAIEDARKRYESCGVSANFLSGDLFQHDGQYDFIWNSGLIQCLEDEDKIKLLKHTTKLTRRLFLFYPDTDSPTKEKGTNQNETPGVRDAVEYSIQNVPLLFSSVYNKVYFGRIYGSTIEMPFDMIWIYGMN